MADGDVDRWIKEVEGHKFTSIVIDIHAKIYDLMEYKRSKTDKVTAPLVATIKKAMDFLLKQCTEISEENRALNTRLEDKTEYGKMMEDLAQKISRASVSSMEEVQPKIKEPMTKRRDDFTVILTPTDEQHDLIQIKEKVKDLCRGRQDLPTPNDVIMTKSNQVILKYKNKKEVETIKNTFTESEDIKELAKVNVPVRKRDRILILSVDPTVKEEVIKEEVEKLLQSAGAEDTYGGIREKLESTTLDVATKNLLEGLLRKVDTEVRIIRKIDTRQGKVNWLLDVDQDGKQILLRLRRICLDYERYRVVEFISITRCFKCQKFGHMANNCKDGIQCVKCAEGHLLKDCKSAKLCCANCYYNDATGDCDHRADSVECPVFQSYRNSVLPNRS